MTSSPSTSKKHSRRETPLTEDETVTAARQLIDEIGFDRFSMRALGLRLNVNPMTIYLRFENKDALLQAVTNQVLSEIRLPTPTGTWKDQVVDLASALRSQLLEGSGAAAARASLTDLPKAVLEITERGLHLMAEAGLEGAECVNAFRSIFWVTLGFALSDDNMRSLPLHTTSLAKDGLGDALPLYNKLESHFASINPDQLFQQTISNLADGIARSAEASK